MVSSGSAQIPGTPFSVEPRCAILPASRCVHGPRSSWNPIFGGLLWRLHHNRHDQFLTQFPVPFFSTKSQGGTYCCKFLTMTWPFWDQPHPGAYNSHLIRTKDILITQDLSRDLKTLCQEPGSKVKHYNKFS